MMSKTPLMEAAGGGHREMAFFLLERGADLFKIDGNGRDAEEHARKFHHFALADALAAEKQRRALHECVGQKSSKRVRI